MCSASPGGHHSTGETGGVPLNTLYKYTPHQYIGSVRAIFNDKIIAESDDTIVVEGNHYFPPRVVNKKYLKKSDTKTVCHWKGEASYYDVVVGDKKAKDGAWYYPEPTEEAENIKNYVAFWNGVRVKKD